QANANVDHAQAQLLAAIAMKERALQELRRLRQEAQQRKPSGASRLPGEGAPSAEENQAPDRRQPVAYIFDTIPLTREELGEYLIARHGAEKLEAFVNHRILEHASRQKGITVIDAEVEARLEAELKELGVSRQEFGERVLKQYHKTLDQWKQDVV